MAKRERERLTIYLPPDVAKRLRLHAVEHDSEMSDIVERALEKLLSSDV